MKIDVSALFSEKACRVVFVNDSDTSVSIEDAVVGIKPEYKIQTNPAFLPRKFGPFTFRNRKCIWEILMKSKTAWVKGFSFLIDEMEKIEASAYEYRSPRALSKNQLMRASVLYDVLDGKRDFIMSDCTVRYDGEVTVNREKDSFITISKYMMCYEEFRDAPCNLIWITDLTPSELFEKLSMSAVRTSFYSFFTVINDSVVECNKKELIATLDTNRSIPTEYLVENTSEDDDESDVAEEITTVEKKPFILD